MAALPTTQFPVRHMNGDSDRYAVFSLLNINAGDTVDLQEFFTVVKRATLLGVTVAAAVAATVSGTVVTVPAGANADAAILTAYGVAKQ
jgi:hypothetical protein